MTMKLIRTGAGLAVLALLTVVALGQDADETPAPRDGTAGSEQRAPEPEPATEQSAADDVFIPTEEIPADEEVTFPVDI